MKNQTIVLAFFTMLYFLTSAAMAQETTGKNEKSKKAAVENKSFNFTAQYAQPMKGGNRYLTGNYFLKVKKDTVISDLPYMGRVFAPSMSGEGGLKFTSLDFTHETKMRKKGGYDVLIRTRDTKGYTLRFTLFEDGNATLSVSGTDRESISYRGTFKYLE